MRYPSPLLSLSAELLLYLFAAPAIAAPSVNVALKASFDRPPYLVELLETAAQENETAYFPLLDRVAGGHFDGATTDKELYELFLQTLQQDGHLVDLEALSSFQFALAVHSAAPRIEAHYQFYNTSVEASLATSSGGVCESWVHFNGRQYCSPDLAASAGQPLLHVKPVNLPFDRILGDSSSNMPSIIYADLASPSFRQFHHTISATARSGKTTYRLRYKPSLSGDKHSLFVSGYGVEMALKRTDYIVIDDRKAEDDEPAETNAVEEATLADTEVTDLRPLSSSELRKLDLKAATFVMNSGTPFETLLKLSQDFPKHSTAIVGTNVSRELQQEHRANCDLFLPQGQNIIWINGVQVLPRDFDAYAMLEHLRRERKLINSAIDLGFTGEEAIRFMSHTAISEAQNDQDSQRYDWRDDAEGGNVILWMNDIEKDKRYADWPETVRALLQRTYPGQLPSVRKDIHNVVLPIDFSSVEDITIVVQNIQMFVKRSIPIRFGLVPTGISDAARRQAAVMDHLTETYGLSAALTYLQKSLTAQGRKHSAPVQSSFDQAIKDREVRRDRVASTFQQIVEQESVPRFDAAKAYLKRLGLAGNAAPFLANGVAVTRDDEWMPGMSNRVATDTRILQQAVYENRVTDDSYVPDVFLATASTRRNPIIIPEDEKDLRLISLAATDGLREGFIGAIPSIHASSDTVESELVHLVVAADFDSSYGGKLYSAALAFRKEHDNVELFFVHTAPSVAGSKGFSDQLYEAINDKLRITVEDLENLTWSPSTTEENMPAKASTVKTFWGAADPLLKAANVSPSDAVIIISGRVVGPLATSDDVEKDDLETLLAYERKKRLIPAGTAIKELGLIEKAATPFAFAKLSNLLALSTVSDVPEGIFGAPPQTRTSIFEDLQGQHCMIGVGDRSSATIQITAAIDPASEQAQRYLPILKVLSELNGVYLRVFMNPRERLEELPTKRFYRHVLHSKPSFDESGHLRDLRAEFGGLPEDALLTIGMDMPPAWLVSPKDSIHDLDNLKLSTIKSGNVEATYQLDHILIEGHSRDVASGPPPRGAQLVLGTQKDTHVADTIIMSNLGYFQFKANPGFYNLSLQRGRSEEIFHIDSAGTLGYGVKPGDEVTEIAHTSFRGSTLFPRLSRQAGMEDEDVLESSKSTMESLAEKAGGVLSQVGLDGGEAGRWLSKASKFGSSLLTGKTTENTDVQTLPHADINIFSVASGHLYERMLNIMMVSVMKHTSHTVKFWFIEQFLSPSFKAFLPIIAEEYGFRYEMVTYKWPHWLRHQKEKQREIWGYKILFLDVLFPLDLNKVIFVDADQIVRTDMYELVQLDLKGAPYGFTPMCNSRTEMEGFRFWKQGYWKNFLKGLPYHISALYVVDLQRFRQMAAGDRLRQQYHQLSADPASLSNLDQDLPNHMQHVIPIHSLPQEWLWCETWCSDESLGVARTIDLCNNPQTKEPKLDRARRQVPEWTIYDSEVAALAARKAAAGGDPSAPIAGSAEGSGAQEQAQAEEAEKHRKSMQDEIAKTQAGTKETRSADHAKDEL